MSSFTVYSTQSCSFCKSAKSLLEQREKQFEMKYIDTNEALMEEFRAALPGVTKVPQIFLNEGDGFHQYIGGYTDLVEYFRTHE